MIGTRAFVASALLTTAVVLTPASAQDYPNKPIKLVVPTAPAGIGDIIARQMQQKLGESGVTAVVENRPGAAGVIGVNEVAKAPADGYTFLVGNHAVLSMLPHLQKIPYDPVKSFTPVFLAVTVHNILVIHPSVPAKDVKELIAYAKANPGKVNFGSSGIGAAAHLTTELLKQTAGIDMVHVPYKGTAPALTAVMANDIQVLVDVPSTLMPHVRGGKIKALAMFSKERIQGAAEVPTMAEAGGPPLESSTWVLFMAPGGTPKAIVDRLAAETEKAINESDIKERFSQIGIEPVGGTPEQAARFLDAEIAKWAKVINTAGVKAEQ